MFLSDRCDIAEPIAGGELRPERPRALTVCAALFIAYGVFAALEVLVGLFRNHVSINFGVLAIFIGYGLMRCDQMWRTWALVCLWAFMILTPVLSAAMVIAPGDRWVFFLGAPVALLGGTSADAVVLMLGSGVFAVSYWQYRTLVDPSIKMLFTNA